MEIIIYLFFSEGKALEICWADRPSSSEREGSSLFFLIFKFYYYFFLRAIGSSF